MIADRRSWTRPVAQLALFAAASFLFCLFSGASAAEPAHGFSPLHPLKYEAGFRHFDYVNPDAPQGGTLRLGAVGNFDSLNTLRYPGSTPAAGPERFSLRGLVYDSLLVKSADEPAGYYGLLAGTVEVADDYAWVRFRMRRDARWHDGAPVTAHDVVFTFETLKEQGPPFQRQVLRGVEVEAEDERTVLITAARPGDREFVGRVGGVAIHPEHYWQENDATSGSLDIPLGSGPYRIASAEAGRKLVLERADGYWGRGLPVNAGRHNFERIELVYYRDDTVALEAFRSGAFDMRVERDAVQWATGYEGPAFEAGEIVRNEVALGAPGRLMSLVFNVRRKLFRDVRVRRAIALAYDFRWTNRNLLHGQYEPVRSFFGDTRNAASDAAGEGERAILEPHLEDLPAGILKAASPYEGQAERDSRAALSRASELLDEAGFTVEDGRRIAPETGEPVTIELVYTNPRLPRVLGPFARALDRLGIELKYPRLESVTASKRILGHDYDMAALDRWSPGLTPGTGEALLWGSALADKTPSYALSGAKDPALDATTRAMSGARSLDELAAAARAFDRVLRWRQYAVPLWRSGEIWLARRNAIRLPGSDGLMRPAFVDRAWRTKPADAAAQ